MTPHVLPLPTRGIDLLSEDAQLPSGCVRAAVNVDIDRDGQFSARSGFVQRLDGAGFAAIGVWSGRCWVQAQRRVCWLDTVSYAVTPFLDVGSEEPVASMEYNGCLWLASRAGVWCVTAGGEVKSAPRAPGGEVRVAASGTGALTPGVYGVALSIVDADGVESAARWLGAVRTDAGLAFDGLPVVPGAQWQVYLTAADGDVLYAAERAPALLSRLAVGAPPTGQLCETMGLAPLPGGHAIAAKGGRVYVARDDALLFSRPFRPWLYRLAHDFVRFVGRIRFVQAMEGGLYVGDDRGVWWLAGDDPEAARLSLASNARALERSALALPIRAVSAQADGAQLPAAVWLSEAGYMLGRADGSVRAMQPGRLALDASQGGKSVFLRRDGRAQVLTLTACYEPRASHRYALGAAIDRP